LAVGSDDNKTFELSIAPTQFANDTLPGAMYFNLNLTSVEDVVSVQIHRKSGRESPVVVEVVPSALGWPTATTKNKTLTNLLAPVSGSYVFQGAFSDGDLRGPLRNSTLAEFVEELTSGTAEFFVNVRTTSAPYGSARGALVWTQAGISSGDSDVDGDVDDDVDGSGALIPESGAGRNSVLRFSSNVFSSIAWFAIVSLLAMPPM